MASYAILAIFLRYPCNLQIIKQRYDGNVHLSKEAHEEKITLSFSYPEPFVNCEGEKMIEIPTDEKYVHRQTFIERINTELKEVETVAKM